MNRPRQYVEELAKARRVEELAARVCRTLSADDRADLCQMAYAALLETDADRLADLCESNAINFYIVRILTNNAGKHGQFFKLFLKWENKRLTLLETDEDGETP